jgi:hypothetical protein
MRTYVPTKRQADAGLLESWQIWHLESCLKVGFRLRFRALQAVGCVTASTDMTGPPGVCYVQLETPADRSTGLLAYTLTKNEVLI